MKNYKKTVIGSVVSFIVGTSCCWLSSLAIWLGGAAFLGVIIKWVEDFQLFIILLSIILGMLSIYLYLKNKRRD